MSFCLFAGIGLQKNQLDIALAREIADANQALGHQLLGPEKSGNQVLLIITEAP